MKKLIFSLFVLSVTVTSLAFAQVEREHPRVAELQDYLTTQAKNYLQTRLPGIPFLVTVKIDALRRQTGSNYQPKNEVLPYFDLSDMEIVDEWDDPSASLYTLQSRISRANVQMSLPKSLSEAEVQEVKDAMMVLLRLIPGRDEVRVELRSWTLTEKFWQWVGVASALLVLMLGGLLLISRSWARKLASAIHEIKPQDKKDTEPTVSPINATNSVDGTNRSKTAGSGDLTFRDPIKMREFVSSRVNELMAHKAFPNLEAMIELDRLAETDPKSLGALLSEFPFEKQAQLFSFSYKTNWLTALADPGEITRNSVELVDRLCRLQYNQVAGDWQNLLIQIWRLDDERTDFLKHLNKDESLSVLKDMPSSIAIPTARIAFPGAWAVLLDSTYTGSKIAKERVHEIYQKALASKPLLDMEAVEKYRHEKDLLEYLRYASIAEEKDIYGALPNDSTLWLVRPPFYRVVEAEHQVLQKFVESISIDDWAVALFNVSRDFRKPVESLFSQKQRFLFLSKMRNADQNGLDKNLVGDIRERLAHQMLKFAKTPTQPSSEGITESNNYENKVA